MRPLPGRGPASDGPLFLCNQINGPNPDESMQGILDEVRVFDRQLSQPEIQAIRADTPGQ